jgi:hypothetical protein
MRRKETREVHVNNPFLPAWSHSCALKKADTIILEPLPKILLHTHLKRTVSTVCR